MTKRTALEVLLSLTLGVAGPACSSGARVESPDQPALAPTPAAVAAEVRSEPSLQRGSELYALHCATCHGPRGAGDGTAAYLLSPAPRDFTQARFRLVSSVNGAPTDADLLATLRRGMPGSAMPAWDWMSDGELSSLVLAVRQLALDGRVESLLARAARDEEEMTREEALDIAQRGLTPGAPIEIPATFATDAATVARGRELFAGNCAQCHGADGTARGVDDQWNEDGTPNQPRDFTAGVLKGGATPADFVRRMVAGLPGSPMPATRFADPVQATEIVAYLQTLIRPGAQERGVQTRRTLRARRVDTLPRDAADAAWRSAESVDLPLMPLWWRDVRAESVSVSLLHDREQLAVRLSWHDATLDDEILGQDTFCDAAALQWSVAPNPPLFTMGDRGTPVNIWQWKAAWERDLVRVRGVADRYANTPADLYGHTDEPHEPLYLTARAAGNRMAANERTTAGEALTAEGFGTLAPIRGSEAEFAARGAWSGETWSTFFLRPLHSCCEGELALAPGSRVYVALAIWDGASRDRNGQKSVTVWHVVELEK
jgi:mono/diheme cytochrome c family protein